MVAELKDVCLSFGDRTLSKNLESPLNEGDKLGLIGPNGVGKSSLITGYSWRLSQLAVRFIWEQT